jgi:hypothetical protein
LKRLSTGILTAIVAVGFGLTSVNAQQTQAAKGNEGNSSSATVVAQAAPVPPADFGAPPSGEIPILFNDHHVYSKPDRLKQNRVLAALVRGNTILVPLRSMFEQTGATVSYDPASKTVDVSKPGSDVKVTVGRPEVVINGESRPLDVPPEIYKGTVVVPLRVISEGMGAYVQWVPERKTVVVRYVAAPPPPAPSPTPVPTQAPAPLAPSPQPTAPPRHRRSYGYEHFIVGDYLFDPKVYNEFSPGNKGVGVSYSDRAALEFKFPILRIPLMIEGDYRSIRYPHNDNGTGLPGDPGDVTVIGGYGQTDVPSFVAKDTDLDGRLGVRVANPRIYVAAGYLNVQDNYGYPKLNGVGAGVEKLPDLDQTFSVYGSFYDYPNVEGSFAYPLDAYTCPGTTIACAPGSLYGTSAQVRYTFMKYQIGVSILLTGARDPFGIFLDGGFAGDSLRGKALAPSNASHAGAYAGLGLKF